MYRFDKPDNLVEMFEDSVRKHGGLEFLGTKRAGRYEWVTYREVAERIDRLRAGLASVGVGEGDSVAIIANNCVEWAVACYAAYGRAARFVPMYEAELPRVWKYIVEDSGAKLLFVSTEAVYEATKGFVDEIETLERIVMIQGEGEGTMAELEAVGASAPVPPARPAVSDVAGLIYTSGTTGAPKGVLLSHGNLTSNVHAVVKAFRAIGEQTRTLSFLPWAHAYGQVAELHLLVHVGGSTAFAEGPQTIVDDLQLVRPTLLVAVPRIFNRVYDGLNRKMREQGGVAKALFDMGVRAAADRREALAAGRRPGLAARAKLALADRVVFQKIRQKFGGRLELAVSSSAALSPDIASFFFDIGIPVYEAWGMTELSPAGTLNSPDSYRIGSAGKPIEQVRLVVEGAAGAAGVKGELVVYGPNVMQGYHNKPDATAEVLTDDGGLRTGDLAYLDEDGFLFIAGRIKEQFKLENGKFVHPATIEEELKLLPEIEHAMVFGLNKPYPVAVVVPDFAVLGEWARERGLPPEPAELVKRKEVRELYADKVAAQLRGKLGSYEVPRKLHIVDEPFSTDNGMLTPTLKLKRRRVLERYGAVIEALYD